MTGNIMNNNHKRVNKPICDKLTINFPLRTPRPLDVPSVSLAPQQSFSNCSTMAAITYVKLTGFSVPQLRELKEARSVIGLQELSMEEIILAAKGDFATTKDFVLWFAGYEDNNAPLNIEAIDKEEYEKLSERAVSHKS